MSGLDNSLLNARGKFKIQIFPEREIQIFGQTDLVIKIARWVGWQFHLTRNKQPRWGVWIGQRISRRTLTWHLHDKKNSGKRNLYTF